MSGPGPHTPGALISRVGFEAGVAALPGPTSSSRVLVGEAGAGAGRAARPGVPERLAIPPSHGHQRINQLVPNSGQLPNNLAESFAGARYISITLSEPTILYRAGTSERPLGQFFSSTPPMGITQTRIDKAIPPVWPDGTPAPLNTGFAIKFPEGVHAHVGEVANQGGLYMGGTEQILIQKPWEIEGVELVGQWKLS